jgi:class 3 adenylate cyclase/tetratricopeptide (TPR) repeat protein
MGCPACSQPVPEGARFCPSCGTPLGPLPANDTISDEERRVVTVLFADIVGFTSIAERRDPEQVKRLVDAAFALLVADVEAHGGVVDKVLGDAIVALFGAPIAHEDDADRAVRAALAMQATLRDFRDEHPADELRMRIGVNTGEVLVGTVAGTDYTAMGDVVNTAARLQQVASPGAVLVGDATRALCSPNIRFRPDEDVHIRGRDQEVRVWQAVGHDSALVARRWQSDVPFVGRATELDVLSKLAAIGVGGRSAIVAVTGEPGIGKSRLVDEVVTSIMRDRPDTFLLEGVCAPYGESNLWWPVAGGLLARLGLDRNSLPDESRARVIERLESYDGVAVGTPEYGHVVEVVMHLLGHPSALDALSPAAVRDAVFGGLTFALRRRATRTPVVMWIDDLQWAAPLLLDLLESIARHLVEFPVLILTTYRREDEGIADWPQTVEPALTLHLPLSPMSEHEVVELTNTAAGRSLPQSVVHSISARAGGNPLFITELARLASECPDEPDGPELPSSLRVLIAARLDQLTASQRAILDNAAILGVEGRVAALRAFANELAQPFDVSDVDALVEHGLIVRDGGRWQFRSDVVREVAYGTLTKQARAQRHAGTARYLAQLGDLMLDQRAHHLACAAELVAEIGPTAGVPRDAAAQAANLLVQAARGWYQQGAHRRGLEVIERALGLDPDQTTLLAALLLMAEGLVETRALVQARDVLADVLERAVAVGDRVTHAEALRLRGTAAQMEGDLEASRRDLGEAVGELREIGDQVHLGEALRARGFAEVFGGSLGDAEWFLNEADAVYAEVGDLRGRAWVQQHLAWVSFLAGDHVESQRRLQSSIAAFEEIGDRSGVTWARGLLAYVHHFGRRNAEALELAELVLAEAHRWGDEWGAAMMLNLQASIRLWSGDVDKARALGEKALGGFRRIDDRFGIIQALGTLNRAFVASGRTADAERSVEEIMVLADAFGEMAYPVMAAAGTAMHLGKGRRAAELGAEAVRHLDTTGANVDEARVVSAFGELLDGAPEQALTVLLDVDVDASPFGLAARATASAMLGDHKAAIADVHAVEAMAEEPESNVSYWDLWIARIAGVASAAGAEAQDRADRMRADVETVGDVVVRAYARDVLSRVCDGGEAPAAPRGWADVAAAIAPR